MLYNMSVDWVIMIFELLIAVKFLSTNACYIQKSAKESIPHLGCGITARDPFSGSSRIVGGQEAVPHSVPWQALLITVESGILELWCSGSLITRGKVLTAAHCNLDQDYPDFYDIARCKNYHCFFVVLGTS